jgi:cystathionine beta-lyase
MLFDDLDPAELRRRRGAKWARCQDDVLAAWVADMDFPVAEPIRRVLASMSESADLGYPAGPDAGGLPAVFARRMQQRFAWTVDPHRVEVLTDVVQALHLAIDVFSEEGDGVVTPVPIYPPFLEALRHTKRAPVWQRYVATPGGYRIDFERLHAELSPRTRMMLLCNPHNPTGRVLGREELEALAAIAIDRDLVVVVDEIHADLVFSGRPHLPLASLGPEIAARTITLNSASKAFNIAGLRCSVAAFGSQDLHRRFRRRHHAHARGGIGTLGLAATEAAWTEGQPWLDEVLRHLERNRALVASHAAERWPAVGHLPPEATYLAWLDCRAFGLDPPPQQRVLERSRVLVSAGEEFGEPGRGFVRLNFATSHGLLVQILERMDAALAAA